MEDAIREFDVDELVNAIHDRVINAGYAVTKDFLDVVFGCVIEEMNDRDMCQIEIIIKEEDEDE